MVCKHCGGLKYVKSGFVKGMQRYRCKGCHRHFTNTARRGKPEAIKLLALVLFMSRMSQKRIAQILGVSNVAVMKWIHAYAEQLGGLPEPQGDDLIVEIDEMHHFIKKKRTNAGYGKPCAPIRLTISYLHGPQEDETNKPATAF